ncbi:UvrD-helicase domain-containing protein [Thermovibrio sp.]
MSLTEEDFFKVISEISGKELTENQKKAVLHFNSPLKIVAVPGSGKTEVLVLKALYLLTVRGVHPKSIFLVSFTKKAARELLERLISYYEKLKENVKEANGEPYELYCGTLHSLALKVMDEFQYSELGKYRLMEDFERKLLIYKEFQKEIKEKSYDPLFEKLKYFKKEQPKEITPDDRLNFLSLLFEFIPQNRIDYEKLLKEEDKELKLAGELYRKYRETLKKKGLLDYTHSEELFLNFLNSEEAKIFLKGDGEAFSGVKFVLVDEYQDTNPLDEEIYFTLSKGRHITVVGDDHQSLYRFRGGVVECFIEFESRYEEFSGRKVKKIEITDNFRSDASIVAFANYFIKKHRKLEGYKNAWEFLSEEKRLKWKSKINSFEELKCSVLNFTAEKEKQAEFVKELVKELKDNKIVEKLSDVVLLMPSSREVRKGEKTLAGLVREKLKEEGIEVYNPRSKTFKEQEEIEKMVGALSYCLLKPKGIEKEIKEEVEKLEGKLEGELKSKAEELKKETLKGNLSLLELFYRLLPLVKGQEESKKRNLAKLSSLLSSLERLSQKLVEEELKEKEAEKVLKELQEELGTEGNSNSEEERKVAVRLKSYEEFFKTFLPIFLKEEADLQELPELPEDKFPIMTIHQSKGLEFPIVIVGEVENHPPDFTLGKLEELLSKYIKRAPVSSWERGVVETAKKLFVAYTRAMHLLVILSEGKEEGNDREKAYLPGLKRKNAENFPTLFKEKIKEVKESERGRRAN